MGGRGSAATRNTSSPVYFEVKDYWGNPLENSSDYETPELEDAVKDVQKTIRNILDRLDDSDIDIDHIYDALADSYPFHIYGDEATKIIDNTDAHAVTAVDIRMLDMGNGKIRISLEPTLRSEDEFLTREELDAVGLYERRR